MWFKTSTDAQMTMFDLHNDSNSNNRVRLLVKAGDDYVYLQTFNSSGTENTISAPIDVIDGKWHHVAATSSGTVLQIYIDGKLMKQSTITVDRDSDPTMRLRIGRLHTSAIEYWNGCIDELRIWNAVRTQTEIRDNMFKSGYSNLSNNGGLMAAYDFDAGTTNEANNANALSEVGARDITLYDGSGTATDLWAGAGAFDEGSTTLVMAKPSGTQRINYKHVEAVNNLTINDGSTTQLWNTEAAGNGLLDIEGNLTVNEKLKSHADKAESRIRFTTAGTTIAVGSDVKTTALSELYSMEIEHSGSTNIPELTTPRLFLDSTATAVATGDLTLTQELLVNSGTTFNANGKTITVREVDVDGSGTLNLSNSTLDFSVSSSNDHFSMEGTTNLLTGNTTITGNTGQQTPATLPEEGNFEVVGDVSDLKIMSDGDLTVIGSVTNCLLQTTEANIRQWHHTLDTQQLLDADENRDDDLRLTKPALDNALELMTK